MYRRRARQNAEIAFSFDSFLDMVANVCGIIIRLILVAWVGGRSYSALKDWQDSSPAEGPAVQAKAPPRPEDEPLSRQIADTQHDLAAARARLLAQLRELELAHEGSASVAGRLTSVRAERAKVAGERAALEKLAPGADKTVQLAALSMAELRQRQDALRDEIKKVEGQPIPKKELRYRTPVSRAVHSDEVHFECQGGRVTFIDLTAFLQEIHEDFESKGKELRTSWKVEAATHQVGAFRVRYLIERAAEPVDELGGSAAPRGDRNFSYGLSAWVLEPVVGMRGEPLEAALAPTSEFRRQVDRLDPTIVVTFWVYPDSFEVFRRLRDHLYDRGIEVAGRPLTPGSPIAASRNGSASRGQ